MARIILDYNETLYNSPEIRLEAENGKIKLVDEFRQTSEIIDNDKFLEVIAHYLDVIDNDDLGGLIKEIAA